MSNIKALEKLRELCADVKSMDFASVGCDAVLEIVDEIEQEIAERYMELPVDADGVPIHIGDELYNKNKPTDTYKVTAIADNGYLRIYHDTAHIHSSQCRHAKPRTIEDVLRDVVTLCANTWKDEESAFRFYGVDEMMRSANLTDYAEEIRGMMA